MTSPAEQPPLFDAAARVTDLRPDPKDPTLLQVYVGSRRVSRVPVGAVAGLAIERGVAWTAPLAGACDRAMELRRAIRRAGAILKARGRSTAEIRERLIESGFEASIVAEAIGRLCDQGVLDDAALAQERVEEALRRGPAGDEALRSRLERAGISDATIRDAVTDAGPPEARALKAVSEVVARLPAGLSAQARWRRVLAGLARRGFDEEQATHAAEQALGPPPYDD